jgi:hypothetical protein
MKPPSPLTDPDVQNSRFRFLINHPSDHTIRDPLVKKVSEMGV